MTPARPDGMGWREFRMWLRVMGDQVCGGDPDPDRWTEPSRENFRSLNDEREKMRGR